MGDAVASEAIEELWVSYSVEQGLRHHAPKGVLMAQPTVSSTGADRLRRCASWRSSWLRSCEGGAFNGNTYSSYTWCQQHATTLPSIVTAGPRCVQQTTGSSHPPLPVETILLIADLLCNMLVRVVNVKAINQSRNGLEHLACGSSRATALCSKKQIRELSELERRDADLL